MKELSTEEKAKAKAYEERLDTARHIYADPSVKEEDKYYIEVIFPELKKSEDEKIRKELITHCRNTRCVTEEGAKKIAKWIAWLEKQGEQKQYDIDVLEKHITKDSISELAHTVIVRNGWEIVDAKEQNPVWSEEDEKMLDSAIRFVELSSFTMIGKGKNNTLAWLKSLKERIGG